MSTLFVNIQALTVCAVMLAILFFFNLKYWRPNYLNTISLVYVFTFVNCMLEIIAYSIDGHAGLAWLNRIVNGFYLSFIDIILLCWISYCSENMNMKIWSDKIQKILFLIPGYVIILLNLSSVFTGFIFYVDEAGFYHRSSTFYFQYIPYVYLIITTAAALSWKKKAATGKDRRTAITMALFPLPTLVFGTLQVMVPPGGLATMELSLFMGLLIHYCEMQDNRVTLDGLTKLPNRVALDSAMTDLVTRSGESKKNMFIMMADINDFKQINDTYGHVKGDEALIIATKVLSDVANKYRGQAYRFGGDEFAMIFYGNGEYTDSLIRNELDSLFSVKSEETEYNISMSCGFCPYQSNLTENEMIEIADKELYREKAKYRRGKRSAKREHN